MEISKVIFMKYILLSIPLLFPAISIAGLFGATTYEECVLDNIKNAQTNDAVNTVHAMCSAKFSKDKNAKEEGVKICKLYWNGWELKSLDKPLEKNKFFTFDIARYEVKALEISLPKEMVNTPKREDFGTKFFNEHINEVMRLCSFK